MPTPPLSDECLQEAVAALEVHGSQVAAATALGIPRTTLQSRLERAAERGLMGFAPVLPGFAVHKTSITTDATGEVKSQTVSQRKESGEKFEMPDGLGLMGVSAYVDKDDRVLSKWILARKDKELAALELIDHIKTAFADFEGRAAPVDPPNWTDPNFLNLIPCNDWHVNLLTWKNQVGINWDLDIAEQAIGDAIETVIKRSRRAGVAVVLGGGDLMHNDDNTNRTSKSHNVLDADGRHSKGLRVAERLKVRTIDCALEHNDQVEVRILEGNHDEVSSTTIAHFLHAWYRNEPRVKVSLDNSLFWYRQFGRVMLAATHGHTIKLDQMPMIMAHRQAEMWGATKFRYAHGFHVHHRSKVATEGNGVICESHQAPIPQDGWHYGAGYLSGRSVKVITYHRALGFYTEVCEPILDAGDELAA